MSIWWRDNHEHFLMVNLHQHITIVSFVVEGCLKMWPFNPKLDDLRWNSWRPRKNLWLRISSPTFYQNLSNYVDEDSFCANLNNDPKLTLDDLWPQISAYPYCPLNWWVPSITKIHRDIFEKKHFLTVNGHTKERYTDTLV